VLYQFTRRVPGVFGVGVFEVVTAKYNSSGVRQWINFINSADPGMGFQRFPGNLVVSPGGNVYITFEEVNSGDISDSVLLKYDTNGKTQWSHKQSAVQSARPVALGLDAHEKAYALVDLSNQQQFGGDFTTIFKYDLNGNLLASFSTDQVGLAHAFHVDSTGALYLLAFGNSGDNTVWQVASRRQPGVAS